MSAPAAVPALPSLEEVISLFARSEFVGLFALQVLRADRDQGTLSMLMPFNRRLTIFAERGNYHGGAIATLIDIAASMCCVYAKGYPTPTVDLRVDYLASPRNVDLIASAQMRHVGKRLCIADVDVRDEAGQLYAFGRGSFSVSNPRSPIFSD